MFWNKKAILLSLVLASSLATVSLALSDSWTSKTDMPTARRNLSAAVLNGKIYAVGGTPGTAGGLSAVEEYDPATDTWKMKSSMPTARGGLSISAAAGRLYAFGGMTQPSSSFTTVEEYDPAANKWTARSPMPTRRFALSTSTVNGKIYAIGGQGSWPNVVSRVEEYDPGTDTWTRKADMPTARAHLSTAVVNGKIYAIGGILEYPEITSIVEEYDPATNIWIRRADMPTARPHFAATVLNGKIYAIGGAAPHPDGPPVSTVEEYDPATDTWTSKADMLAARSFLSAGTVNGKIYAIGGATTDYPWNVVSTVEEYDPGLPPPDFNGDGIVDSADTRIMVDHWGTDDSLCDIAPIPWGDGIVDVQDLIVLSEHLFEPVNDPTLIAHWALDEIEGSTAHDSVSGSDDFVIGGALWQPDGGRVNGALELDGLDDCLITTFGPNPADGPFSILAWIKGGGPGQSIISQPVFSDWLMADPSAGKLMTELKDSSGLAGPLVSETVITDGQWHRIGLVWDGSHRTICVDGVTVGDDAQPGLESSQSGLYIGVGKNYATGTFFSGLIDEIRIYNRAVHP